MLGCKVYYSNIHLKNVSSLKADLNGLWNMNAPDGNKVQNGYFSKGHGQGHKVILPSQQCWRSWSNAAVRVWLGEWVRMCLVPIHFALWAQYRLVFVESLSIFTCKLLVMRGGTLLIKCTGSWGQNSRSTLALWCTNSLAGGINTRCASNNMGGKDLFGC